MRYLTEVELYSEIFKSLKELGASDIEFNFQRNDVAITYEAGKTCWTVYGNNIEQAVKQFKYHADQENSK